MARIHPAAVAMHDFGVQADYAAASLRRLVVELWLLGPLPPPCPRRIVSRRRR